MCFYGERSKATLKGIGSIKVVIKSMCGKVVPVKMANVTHNFLSFLQLMRNGKYVLQRDDDRDGELNGALVIYCSPLKPNATFNRFRMKPNSQPVLNKKSITQ